MAPRAGPNPARINMTMLDLGGTTVLLAAQFTASAQIALPAFSCVALGWTRRAGATNEGQSTSTCVPTRKRVSAPGQF